MADDGAVDREQEQRQLEDRLREVGKRLQAPPDAAEDLFKLLDEVEECLLKVEQSPPQSTSNAIRPATKALVKKELFGHADPNVRLAVASCISEITRITAPDAPYDDDVMKDVFSLIVGAFQDLDDIESPFFRRRASILDTVAKVRSCVVMLDLECDDLIRDMFHHFVRTVSSEHSEAVISCMETIMKLVIEESEDVQPQIASCLLENVRKEEKESSSPPFVLAEKVIGMCREKLKPVFLQLLKGTSLNEYSQVVTSVCEGGSDDKEDNNADPSGKDTVDDGKLSERTISDELPQESSKVDQDVSHPEQDGTSMNGTPGTAIGSGATPADNGAESIAAKPKKSSALDSDKNLKLNLSETSEATAHSNADIKKETFVASGEAVNGASDDTSRPADTTPIKPKRGRPPAAKSLEKKAAGKNQPSSLDLKKVEDATESAGKSTKRSAKDDVKSSVKKAGEGESSKKHQKSSSKQQKDETLSKEGTAKDLSLKEMVSPKSSTKGPGRSKGPGAENSTSKRVRQQETEEPPRSRKNKGLDGTLVGTRIKVWWPDDKMFYNGVVDSFDYVSKRHKVAYDDGDVEVLLLRDEKWEFISEEKGTAVAPDTPRGRKRKGDSLKEGNTETPKSDGGDLPKKRGRPKGVRSSNGTPVPSNNSSATPSSKVKTASRDVKETDKTGSDVKMEVEKSSKDKATRSTEKTKDELPKDGGDKSANKPKEATSRAKDLKDESKSTEGKARPGRKPKHAGTPADNEADKEKRKEKEGKTAEIEQEAPGIASTGKKRRRKA
ncbi:sister chromatid cohesion protein PDS5 homolog C-like isoform X2 [Phragmites australis]|uniref:sister chromatid cohesion protein PDS5 homolog C-like isoform X2 n=1 Tax=Phragmites australis TaxID=29695 RepID=UPI002D7954BA|nr:sister chromatid cohesion protein PDS5 homolog C-like isoform X2 [Phragmites australis]